MSWHKFAATGAKDTCLWCGRILRRKHHVQRERTTRAGPPASCRYSHDYEPCGGKKFYRDGDGYRCEKCSGWAAPVQRSRITKREPAFDKPGDYGDGFFCGLRCAYQFAVRLAETGQRLVRRVDR